MESLLVVFQITVLLLILEYLFKNSPNLNDILGTIEGRLSNQDLIYKNRVVIMPLEEVPEKRRKAKKKAR